MLKVLQRSWFPAAILFNNLFNFPYFAGINSANELPRIYLTMAMVDRHAFNIDPELRKYVDSPDTSAFRGKLYSNKAPGMSFLAVPAYWAQKLVSGGKAPPLKQLFFWLRLFASTIYSHAGSQSRAVYVHAKLAVIDDRWLMVGSANLNDRSLFNDTELNLAVYDPGIARTTRQRLWAEHLELPLASLSGHPTAVIDELWKPLAEEQHMRRAAGGPMTHRLTQLPHVSWRSERLLGPLQGLFLDG